MSEEVRSVGWEAIDNEMERLYGKQEPKHYGTLISYALGGPDPLEGISAYVSQEPFPHWHLVTYGFSDLYENENKDSEYSGYGFELTFRLKKDPEEEEPPAWSLNFLQNLGRYVFSSGNLFREGDYLNANGPIALETDTLIQSIAFIQDPELPPIETENGSVEFLQVVGITLDELEAMQMWNTLSLLQAASPHLPLYITDLQRQTFMDEPMMKEALEKGMEQDGSNTGFLFLDNLQWLQKKSLLKSTYTLTVGAKDAPLLAKILKGRISKKRDLTLIGADLSITFTQSEQSEIKAEEANKITIGVNDQCMGELEEVLVPYESKHNLNSFKKLIVQIVKSEIKDQDGKVVKTIG